MKRLLTGLFLLAFPVLLAGQGVQEVNWKAFPE